MIVEHGNLDLAKRYAISGFRHQVGDAPPQYQPAPKFMDGVTDDTSDDYLGLDARDTIHDYMDVGAADDDSPGSLLPNITHHVRVSETSIYGYDGHSSQPASLFTIV